MEIGPFDLRHAGVGLIVGGARAGIDVNAVTGTDIIRRVHVGGVHVDQRTGWAGLHQQIFLFTFHTHIGPKFK